MADPNRMRRVHVLTLAPVRTRKRIPSTVKTAVTKERRKALDPNAARFVPFQPGGTFQEGFMFSPRVIKESYDQVAREMTRYIQRRIDTPYPPASRPGEHPHRRSGDLKKNTEAINIGRKIVIRTLQYGIWLEKGTKTKDNKWRMRPRPFIRRNIQDEKRMWTNRLNYLIDRKSIEPAFVPMLKKVFPGYFKGPHTKAPV